MLSKCPSWVVATVGATIVIIATATGSFVLHTLWEDIEAKRSTIAKAHRDLDQLWSHYHQADQRDTAADVFFGQALGNEGMERILLLSQAALYYRDAVSSMLAASGKRLHEQMPREFTRLEHELRVGDFINAYGELEYKMNELRRRSRTYLNEKSAEIREMESRVESVQASASSIYLANVFFNLLGFMITACKDLPLWRVR